MTSTTTANAERGAIRLEGVTRHFGTIHAVEGVDLEIRAGELFGLIGHNGAGKSTLFKMMLGLVPLSAGRITIDGQDNSASAFRLVRRRIGYLPENVVLYDNLSGRETLAFFARLKHCEAPDITAVLAQVGLQDAADRPVRDYSKGMRQRLGFAQALLGDPKWLFLDEPTNGLDPEAIRTFYACLHDLRDAGVTIILTSHILSEIQERVDRIAIMAAGRLQAVGSVQTLREQVDLPLRIDIHTPTAPAQSRVVEAVTALGLVPRAGGGDRLMVECPRALKLQILQVLTGLGPDIRDLHVREPSLEDVFFGFAA